MDKLCPTCGSRFRQGRRSNYDWARQRFCSMDCYKQRLPLPLAVRFWRYVRKGDGCWEWTAALGGSGYGTFGLTRDRQMPAHRFSWELHNGQIPPGLFVCHHCDNRLCVRPDHLFLGTAADNNRDMDEKGRRRSGPMPGEANHNAKLTEAQVREIRRRRADGESNVAIAADFGISTPLVSYIFHRKAWSHVA